MDNRLPFLGCDVLRWVLMRKQFLYMALLSVVLLNGCEKQPTILADTTETKIPETPKIPFPIARVATRVADRLPHIHLNRNAFDDTIATNALMLFIDSLDFDRSYFLAADIAEFKLQGTTLDDQIKAGNADFAQTVFNRFKERVINRIAYANQLLDKEFDLTPEETYRWKRDKEPWPGTEDEWNELWRKKIKNEVVGRVAALETEPEETGKEVSTHETAAVDAVSTNKTVTGEEVSTHDTAAVEAVLTNKTGKVKEVSTNETVTTEILSPTEFVRERYKQYQLLIETNFDEETILEKYLSAFARSYDPHSDYLSPRGVEDFDIHMSLSLVGIGAMLRSEDGAAKIQSLITGGPAESDGRLKPGDKIIAVAQGDAEPESILHWPLSKAVRLIRGEKGTQVVLTIIPAGDATGARTKKIDLIRDEVKLEEQAAKSEIHEVETPQGTLRLGQLILPEFYADFQRSRNGDADARRCSVDVRRILERFSTNQIDGVIIDLRNDGGGSLSEAIDITGFFIPLGPVVQVRERRGVAVLPDGDPSTLYSGPLIVLVNRLSASASEIVAAALQDYGRAVIVGDRKTHGKGSVQTVFPLSKLTDDLGSIKVTTANFYRIAGGSTQLRGVTPDVILPSLFDSLEIGEEFLPNALPWSQVRSAYFRPWRPSVKPLIFELQTRSEARMADAPSFQSFLATRDRIRDRMKNPTVSLKLSDRVDEILAEEEMETLQEDLVSGNEDEEDPVLEETLQVLANMIELSGAKPKVLITQTEAN